jgi:heme exporter protein D
MPSPLPVPNAEAGVSELLAAGTHLFRLALPKCLPIAMIAALIFLAPSLLLEAQGLPMSWRDPPTDPRFWIEYGISKVLVMLLFTLVTVRQRALLRGIVPDLRREAGQIAARLPVLLPAWLLAFLGNCLGTVLFVLPGLYLVVCFAVLPSVVMFEDRTVFGSLKRSIELMHKRWMQKFAVFLIGFMIALVCIFFALLIIGIFLESSSGNAIVQAIQRALYVACFAVLWTYLSSLSLMLYTSASSSA